MGGAIHAVAALGATIVELGSNETVQDTDGITATAAFGINRTGNVQFTGDTIPADFDWATPKWATVGDSYHVRANVSGTAPDAGDLTGSWLALSTSRSWTWTRSITGADNAIVTLLISQDGGSTTLDSVVYTVNAIVP